MASTSCNVAPSVILNWWGEMKNKPNLFKNEECLRLSSIKEILANFKCIADQILCCEERVTA